MSDPQTIDGVIRIHGHVCPVAMGIRAGEVALAEIGPHSGDEEVVAIVETDMCGVDAIHFLTGCTFGKGNLIHPDFGKNAYTFVRRSDGTAEVPSDIHCGAWTEPTNGTCMEHLDISACARLVEALTGLFECGP